MTITWQAAGVILAIVAAIFASIGVAIRFGLVPYLRETLINPVAQINQQVSVNGGTSETPTILDKLHDVQMEVREARMEVNVLSRMYDGHLEWSQNKVDEMSREIKQARKLAERMGEGK